MLDSPARLLVFGRERKKRKLRNALPKGNEFISAGGKDPACLASGGRGRHPVTAAAL
jgi:hypothetical protein